MTRFKSLPNRLISKNQKSITAKDLPAPLESDIQTLIIDWAFTKRYKKNPLGLYIHHSPNGGSRHHLEAKKFKDMGTRAGYPDLIIDIAKGGYHGMKLELKRTKKETTTPNQKKEIARLREEGYYVVVCCGYDESTKEIEDYVNGLRVRESIDSDNTDDQIYNIKANVDQVSLISHACEVLARIRIGQLKPLIDELPTDENSDNIELLEMIEKNLKNSIKKPNIIDDSFTIHQTIRHRLSWDKNPNGGTTVNFDKPLVFDNRNLIEINKVCKKKITNSIFLNQPPNILSAHIDKNGKLFINECLISDLVILDGQHICQEEGKWSYPIGCGYDVANWQNSAINRYP